MNATQAARRVGRFLFGNWPLKLAAMIVASLLYAGLVLSQDSDVVTGRITVARDNQPAGTVVLNVLRDVEEIRYIAPADIGRLRADDFRVTVDLGEVPANGEPTTVDVSVEPLDRRVTVLEVRPRSIQVVLDASIERRIQVVVDRGDAPAELEIGPVVATPAEVVVRGPASLVNQVDHATATVSIDPSGLDVDRELRPVLVDANGDAITGVDLDPDTVRVTIPVYIDRRSRTVPVNPVLNGTPAPGFRIAAIEVDPQAILVLGDADQLRELVVADTTPIQVFGATSDVVTVVAPALPNGISTAAVESITVRVRIVPITETRTFQAGLRLDGASPAFDYDVGTESVLVTLFGSVAELDRLSSAPLVLGVSVASLGPGVHTVAVAPSLPTGVTVAALSPGTVTVVVRRPSPSPSPTPQPGAATPEPSPEPSATP